MSESILFPTHQSTSDSVDGSIVHIDHKPLEEQGAITSFNNVTESQKIAALHSGKDWYQQDLSHLTTNLMSSEIARTTALTPVLNSQTDISHQYQAIQRMSFGIGNGGVNVGGVNMWFSSGGAPTSYSPPPTTGWDAYDIASKATEVEKIFLRMLERLPDEPALGHALHVIYQGSQSIADQQYQMAMSPEIRINIIAIGKSVLGHEPDAKQIAAVQKEISGYAASRDDIRKIFAGESIEKTYLDTERHTAGQRYQDFNPASASNEITMINKMYLNLLGYNADPGGLGYYYNEMMLHNQRPGDIQKAISKAPDAYKHIQTIGSSILGYNPDDAWVKQIQNELSVYGKGQQDIRNSFVNSQAAYDAINKVTSTMFGQPVNSETVKYYQANLANGGLSSIADVKTNFANSQAVYDAINKVTSTIFGQSVNSETVKYYQANLANGGLSSIADVKTNFANSQAVYDAINKVTSTIFGQSVNSETVKYYQANLANGGLSSIADVKTNFANSQAVYDAINKVTSTIFGQSVNSETVKYYQANLANGGLSSIADVKTNFANSQAVYDSIKNNASRILGYNWDNSNNIHKLQVNLANGDSMRNIINGFAYGEEVYNSIKNNASRILGYSWDNSNNIRKLQDNLANGDSMHNIINGFVYGEEVSHNVIAMYERMMGRHIDRNGSYDMDWYNWQLTQLEAGKSFQDLNHSLAHDERVGNTVIAMYERMMGRHIDRNGSYDMDWYNWQLTQLEAGKSFQDLNHSLAHDERVGNTVIAMYERMMGRHIDRNGSYDMDWYNWQLTQLEAGKSFQDLNHSLAYDERVKGVLVNKFYQLKGHNFNINNSNDANWLSWAQQQLINGSNVNNLS